MPDLTAADARHILIAGSISVERMPAIIADLAHAVICLDALAEGYRIERAEAMAILDAGRLFSGVTGEEVPTTLVERARVAAMALGTEAQEATRLARILVVERGDWREVPPGWEPRGADMWVRGTSPGRPVIQRWHRDGQATEWLRRGEIDGQRWPTALEAMEAIDAEVTRG